MTWRRRSMVVLVVVLTCSTAACVGRDDQATGVDESWHPTVDSGTGSPDGDTTDDTRDTTVRNDTTGRVDTSVPAPSPCLELLPVGTIDFGSASPNQTVTERVILRNCNEEGPDVEVRQVRLTDPSGVFGFGEQVPDALTNGDGMTLANGAIVEFSIEFEPKERGDFRGALVVESNDVSPTRDRIPLVAHAERSACPEAVATASVKGRGQAMETLTATPLETIQLDGSESRDPDGRIARYEWSIVERPEDSAARLTPSADVEKPALFLDLAGTYVVELVVYDDEGRSSECRRRALVEITARFREDIHVQLVWETPGDSDQTDGDGADLDLHYLDPEGTWGERPYDIFWKNKTADWGRSNFKQDDPSLDIDDTDGRGPENINHNNPENGKTYSVGVYYKDPNGFGPSYATVRIYVDGQLKREFADKKLEEVFDFWKVGLIEWPSKNIYQRDEMFEGYPTN